MRHWLARHGSAYLLAVAGALIAAALRFELGPILGGAVPVVIFTVPVVISALYGGFGPGIACTLVSAAISSYLFISPYSPLLSSQASVILLLFLAIGTTISYFGQQMKTLQARLAKQASNLEAANRELAHANASKDVFLAMLAHELRNPLAGISTAAELLKFIRADQQRIAQTGEMISRQVWHMSKLVDDLLDVSRVTRGLVTVEKKPVDLTAALHGALEQVRAAVASKRQVLEIDVPDEPVHVCGDRTRLTQVISNLLTNANRYSPEGSRIDVAISATEQHVHVAVSDQGQGIAPAFLPRIFDLFVQAERSIDRSQGGLGIGLALVKKITELHEGTVSADSAGLGQGSRFVITLPRLAAAPRPAPTAALPAYDTGAGAPRRILVVDDNRDAADATASLLEANGHTLFVAYSARDALACARAEPLDVVVLDIGLPEQDGRALCRQMKAMPRLAKAVFIALSGYGKQSDIVLSEEAGFDRHFAKPVPMEELLEALGTRRVR
ncbi:ATP-binding protein [Massilia jejuensis]|uniref:histidine kinase n=1 Tax=Massilia jejuensis TaxID=648894 RepID=A0ABW0PN03_9BURK